MLQDRADLLTFSRASKATIFTASGQIVEVGNDILRSDYNPATGALSGWRVEAASADLFGAAYTSPSNISHPSGALDPAGGATARNLIPNGINASHYLDRPISSGIAAGQIGAHSVFVRPLISTRCRLHIYGTGNALLSLTADLAGQGSGTLGFSAEYTAGGGVTVGSLVQKLADGWWRIGIVGLPDTAATTRLCRLQVFDPSGAQSYAGDGVTPYMQYAFPEYEVGHFITSYMMTSPRSADLLRIEGARFSELLGIGAPSGFVILDALLDYGAASIVRNFVQIDDGTSANRLEFRPSTTTPANLVAAVVVGGAQVGAPFVVGAINYGQPTRVGIRWTPTSVAVAGNGSALGTYASPVLPPFSALRIGSSLTVNQLNGRVRGLWAGGFAPSDAKFQAACALGADVAAALR